MEAGCCPSDADTDESEDEEGWAMRVEKTGTTQSIEIVIS